MEHLIEDIFGKIIMVFLKRHFLILKKMNVLLILFMDSKEFLTRF